MQIEYTTKQSGGVFSQSHGLIPLPKVLTAKQLAKQVNAVAEKALTDNAVITSFKVII